MERGTDFLRAQVNNAVMQHLTFLTALGDHQKQAEDPRFRDLCARFEPMMQSHQQTLEQYQESIGGKTGSAKKVLGKALGVARDLVDATRESDFLRLVGDIVMARQSEDTFKTFREAGRVLNDSELARIGDQGERGHDEYVKAANRLVQQMFVEHIRDAEPGTVTAAEFERTGTRATGTGGLGTADEFRA